MVNRIAHVCLAARDLAATQRFYCDGLGFTKVFDFIRVGKVIGFYLKVAEAVYVEVFQQNEVQASAACPIRHVCYETDDIDAVSDRLKAHGYEASEKKLGGDNSWQIWTADPAGVRIEFHQYTPDSHQVTGADCMLG